MTILKLNQLLFRLSVVQVKTKFNRTVCTFSPKPCSVCDTRNVLRNNYSVQSTIMSLDGKSDRYDGITVDSSKANFTGDFAEALEKSIAKWNSEHKRGLWFKVYLQHSNWIPVLTQNGFVFHHTKRDYVMLYKWLPKEDPCNIPPYAHTLIGVGAVVVNDKEEILVVCEKSWQRPHWKLPGGYVDPGENFVDAAMREVFEETGIHTEFEAVLCLRHSHGGQFDCSDLYIVVNLKPLSDDITMCPRELKDCRWMALSEYVVHPHVHELNRFYIEKFYDSRSKNLQIDWKHGIHPYFDKAFTMYHATIKEHVEEVQKIKTANE